MRSTQNNTNNVNNVLLARRNNAVSQNTLNTLFPLSALTPSGFGTGLFDDLYNVLSSPSSPFQVMERMQQDMDRLFSHVLGVPTREQQGDNRMPNRMTEANVLSPLSPTVDVSETEKEYRIDIDLPGVPQDAIEVNIVEGTLTIRAQMSQESSNAPEETSDNAQAVQTGDSQTADSKPTHQSLSAQRPTGQGPVQRQYHYRERRWGRFERMFHLPLDAEEDNIAADFDNGVLTLKIPKKTPQVQQPRGRRITIGSTDSLPSNPSNQSTEPELLPDPSPVGSAN